MLPPLDPPAADEIRFQQLRGLRVRSRVTNVNDSESNDPPRIAHRISAVAETYPHAIELTIESTLATSPPERYASMTSGKYDPVDRKWTSSVICASDQIPKEIEGRLSPKKTTSGAVTIHVRAQFGFQLQRSFSNQRRFGW